jgi:hypothetical protein
MWFGENAYHTASATLTSVRIVPQPSPDEE